MITKNANKEPTNHDILEAVNEFATHVERRFQDADKRFENVDKRFDGMDKRFENVDKRFDGMDKRFENVERRLDRIESTIVTKDYLDEKLSDLSGDLVVLMRKEDRKFSSLVEILHSRKIITKEDVKTVLSQEPFPKGNY